MIKNEDEKAGNEAAEVRRTQLIKPAHMVVMEGVVVLHHCFTTVLRANNLHHFDDNSVGGMNRRSKINHVGTPPPDATWHTFPDDTWHVFSSGFPQEYTWRDFSYPDSLKEISSGLPPFGFPQEYTWRASPIWTPSRRGT